MSKEHILTGLIAYLLLINFIGFIIMGIDKKKAKNNAWRIPEKTLFLPVILGGGIGGILGMKIFHHKTKHWYFTIGFPLICILEYALMFFLIFKYYFA